MTSDRRTDPRRRTMIPAMLGSHPVVVVDLSLGGVGGGAFEIFTDDALPFRPGQRVELTIPRDGPHAWPIEVMIIRTEEEEGRFGARFVDLDNRQRELIRALIERPADVMRAG